VHCQSCQNGWKTIFVRHRESCAIVVMNFVSGAENRFPRIWVSVISPLVNPIASGQSKENVK
jgi:hypothetical protein